MAKLVLLAAVGLFCLNGVIGPRVQCDFSDADCITRTSQAGYSAFRTCIPSVHPFCPCAKISLFMKDQTYDFEVRCPQLTLVGEYDLKGDLLNSYIEGKGPFKVELCKYNF
ncbi:hypothetical protein SFRURICE_010406, partial [Spodoptera frugiperda]